MARPKKEAPNRADGLYEVKVTVGKTFDGQPIRKSFYSPISKGDARQKAQDYILEQRTKAALPPTYDSTITFEEWAETWLLTYKKGKVKNNTYSGTYYPTVHRYLIPAFRGRILNTISPVEIQQFFDQMGKKYALDTLQKMRICLYSIFETAQENELCHRNPVTKRIKLASQVTTPTKRAYSQDDLKRVIEYAKSDPDGLSILILTATGISRSELLGLTPQDFSYEEKTLSINQGTVIAKNPDTGKIEVLTTGLKNQYRRRTIPISSDLAERIQALPQKIKKGGQRSKSIELVDRAYIICNSFGGPYRPDNWTHRVYEPFMQRMVAYYAEQGIHIEALHPHELRHTVATLWKDQGVGLFSIAKLCGWSDLDMLVRRYGHTDTDLLRRELGYEDVNE